VQHREGFSRIAACTTSITTTTTTTIIIIIIIIIITITIPRLNFYRKKEKMPPQQRFNRVRIFDPVIRPDPTRS